MEAKIIAVLACCRDLYPIIDMVEYVCFLLFVCIFLCIVMFAYEAGNAASTIC